jgi:hypothetical protein
MIMTCPLGFRALPCRGRCSLQRFRERVSWKAGRPINKMIMAVEKEREMEE